MCCKTSYSRVYLYALKIEYSNLSSSSGKFALSMSSTTTTTRTRREIVYMAYYSRSQLEFSSIRVVVVATVRISLTRSSFFHLVCVCVCVFAHHFYMGNDLIIIFSVSPCVYNTISAPKFLASTLNVRELIRARDDHQITKKKCQWLTIFGCVCFFYEPQLWFVIFIVKYLH